MSSQPAGTKNGRVMLAMAQPIDAELINGCLCRHPAVDRVIRVTDNDSLEQYLIRDDAPTPDVARPLPDLILLDQALPPDGGLQALREARADARLPRIPIVLMMASYDDDSMLDAYRSGANACVIKPPDTGECERLFADLCNFWLLWNQRSSNPSVPTRPVRLAFGPVGRRSIPTSSAK